MKGGARTGLQNRVAPDYRILAQDFSYLYLNNYTYYLYLKENSKILESGNAPPTINWENQNIESIFIVEKCRNILYI